MAKQKKLPAKPPPSAVALGAVLDENGEPATKLKRVIHRTMLWRFRTGRGVPDVVTASTMHRLTDGRVAADGWSHRVRLRTGTGG